jgi:hypothetical protein
MTVVIGIGGGLTSIIWSRALAHNFYTRRFEGKTDWRGKPVPPSVEQQMRFLYIAVGAFALANGIWALVSPWLSRSS